MNHSRLIFILLMCFLILFQGCEKMEDLINHDHFSTIQDPSITADGYSLIVATRKDASVKITLRYYDLEFLYKIKDHPEYPDYFEVYLSEKRCDNWQIIRTLDLSYIDSCFIIEGLLNDEIYYVYLKEIFSKKGITKNSNVATFIPSGFKPEYSYIMSDYYGHDIYSFDINNNNDNIVYATTFYEYQPGHAEPSIFVSESGSGPDLVAIDCWFPDFDNTGTLIAYSSNEDEVFDGNLMPEHIEIYDSRTKRSDRITSGYSVNKYPTWSPDNTTIAFSSSNESDISLKIKLFNTSTYVISEMQNNSFSAPGVIRYSQEHPVWSADRKYIYYTHHYFTSDNINPGYYDIFRIKPSNGEPEAVFEFSGIECIPVVSPDNSKLAFLTDLNGTIQIWLYDFRSKKFSQPFNTDIYHMSEIWSQLRWKDNNTIFFTGFSEETGHDSSLFSITVE